VRHLFLELVNLLLQLQLNCGNIVKGIWKALILPWISIFVWSLVISKLIVKDE